MGTAEESIRSDMTSRGDEKSRTASICIGTESNGVVWHRHASERFGKDGRRKSVEESSCAMEQLRKVVRRQSWVRRGVEMA